MRTKHDSLVPSHLITMSLIPQRACPPGRGMASGFALRVRMLLLLVGLGLSVANADIIWQEGFEADTSGWTIEGSAGVWEIGVPTTGPGSAHSGTKLAATRLTGNYPNSVDARLISPEFVVPVAGEKPRLRFWSWHLTGQDPHYG